MVLIKEIHDKTMQRGNNACFNALATKYFWTAMYANITQYVRSSELCCKYTKQQKADRAPLQSIPTV